MAKHVTGCNNIKIALSFGSNNLITRLFVMDAYFQTRRGSTVLEISRSLQQYKFMNKSQLNRDF